jgi:hypothetical protein
MSKQASTSAKYVNVKSSKPAASPPEGWETLGEKIKIDGWYDTATQEVVAGKISGFLEYETKWGTKRAAIVTVSEPLQARVKDDDDQQVVADLEPGCNVAITLNTTIGDLYELAVGTRIWVRCDGVKKVQGRSILNYTCRVEPHAEKRDVETKYRDADESAPF